MVHAVESLIILTEGNEGSKPALMESAEDTDSDRSRS
jgi:hypothetical protein